MEKIKNSVGEDDADTDKEEVKGVREKEETEDELETSSGSFFSRSPALRAAANRQVASTPSPKEKRKEIQEKQHKQHRLKGPPGLIPKILTQDTFTAWEKKPPSRERRRVHPPRFSRLLSSLSEEQVVPQEKSELGLEPPKEELEDLVPRPSLQEQLNGQNKGMPVNVSAPSLHHPQQIPAVETVETEPKGLEDQVPSTSSAAENETIQYDHSIFEPKKEDSSLAAARRDAKVHTAHSKILDPADSTPDTFLSVWNMGQRVSHWKLAHQRGYHIDQITQDKTLKNTIMKHERDTKTAVPLPLLEVIEEEALEILKETLKAYQKHLGVNHELTLEVEAQAEKLHLRLKGRGVID